MEIKSVYVEILNKCNMHCCYCYNDSSKDNLPQINQEQFLDIVELMKKYECKNIWISGGEPFLHPDIRNFMKICKDHCLNLGIATNGSYVTDFISDICQFNPFLQISLDSTDKYLNNKYRGEKAFENAVQAIEVLNNSSYSGVISIKSTLYSENSNIESISAMIKFCELNNISDVFFSPCLLQGRAENKKFLINDHILYGSPVESSCVRIHYMHSIYSCELLGDVVNTPLNLRITPTGDVFPCHHLPYAVFNCFEAVDDSAINQLLINIKHNIQELLSRNTNCVSCICKNECNGGCPARRIYEEEYNDMICDEIRRDYVNKIKNLVDGVS